MNINFKLSDSQKHDLLFNLLNPNFNEEGGWMIETALCEIYEDYAIAFNYADCTYERVFYTRDDAEDKVEITKRERCYIVDVNTEEKEALDALKGNYTEAVTTIATLEQTVENLTTENQNYSTKVEELETNISTLTTERDNVQAELHSAQETVNSLNETIEAERSNYTELDGRFNTLTSEFNALTTERDELATFKKDIVDNQKKLVISEYSETLSTEVIDMYTQNMDNYSVEELDMRLAYECKKVNPTIFSKNTNVNPQPQYVPKVEPTGRGINDILAKYEKK